MTPEQIKFLEYHETLHRLLHKVMPMTPDDIIELYDQNPDLTLAQLSRLSGRSVDELKEILCEVTS